MSLDSFCYVDFASRFLAWKCEMYHESTHYTNILFYTNKHNKIKKNCVILENISLLYNTQNFEKQNNVMEITKNLLEQDKDKKREYRRNIYKSMSEEETKT